MRSVFADASYWIALADSSDQWHESFKSATMQLGPVRFFTTEEVLTELLNFYGQRGPNLRRAAVQLVRKLGSRHDVTVLPQTRESFHNGLDLYEQRSDKGYSLTDCISMVRMRESGLDEILTSDKHFRQEGFSLLPPEADE